MKTCSKCRRELSEDRFYRSAHHPSGLYPRCKECKTHDSRSNRRRAMIRNRKRVEAIQPTMLELRIEEEYLMDRLALVRSWITRLSKTAAIAVLWLFASCTTTPPPPFRLALSEVTRVSTSEIDLAGVMPLAARAVLEPDYIGTGPAPVFKPPSGSFGPYQRPCTTTDGGTPILLLQDKLPAQGKRFHLIAWSPAGASQSLQIGVDAMMLPDGTPLPQPVHGAPGCLWELRPVSSTLLAAGRAEFDLILPPGSQGAVVFLQLATMSPGANQAGLLTSRLYRMVIGP